MGHDKLEACVRGNLHQYLDDLQGQHGMLDAGPRG